MKHRLIALALIASGALVQADQLAEFNDQEVNFLKLSGVESNKLDKYDYLYYFEKGCDALRRKDIDNAIKNFKQSLDDNSNAPQTYFNLGLSYEAKDEIDNAIEAYKDAILQRLDYPKAHLQLAKLLQKRGLMDQAITHYEQAVTLDPQLIEPSLTVARLLCEQERFEDALSHFKRFVERNNKDIQVKFEYANALNTANHSEKALELYFELLQHRPNEVSVLHNTAYTLKKLGRIKEAMPYYETALQRNPDHSETHFSLGLAYLATGDFKRGWPQYEYRWQRGTQLSPREFTQPRWDGTTSLAGKTIFLHAEQGLGDTFQFIRFAKELRKQYPSVRIIVAVQKPLHTLISRCCPYINHVITLNQIPVTFDYHSPLMTLPLLLSIEESTVPAEIPYIIPDPKLVTEWKEKLSEDTNIKVGLCCQGNSKYSTPFLRATVAAKSLAMKKFAQFAQVRGVTFYCLQRETGVDQMKNLPEGFNLKIFDEAFDNANGRFMDTAAVMKNLDLIITVDTSTAHIAAAVGVPVWTLLPEPADWRWMLKRPDTPWYPNMRLFRQPKLGDWDSVINTITQELSLFVSKKRGLFIQDEKPPDSFSLESDREPSALRESLNQELAWINSIFNKRARVLSSLPVSMDNPAFSNELRNLYLLGELRNTIKQKIALLEAHA